jgi:hypothetical protein
MLFTQKTKIFVTKNDNACPSGKPHHNRKTLTLTSNLIIQIVSLQKIVLNSCLDQLALNSN